MVARWPYLLLLALVALATLGAVLRGDEHVPGDLATVPAPTPPPAAAPSEPEAEDPPAPFVDPYAWHEDRAEDFATRARRGVAHPLYTQSPGGAGATAARTMRWRARVEDAAAEAGVSPDRLEALIFLESAGRPDAMAPGGLEGAVGLTQILAETATSFLGMRVDVAASERLTRRIERARRRGRDRIATRLEIRRAQVDQRFDPDAALAGAARYLRVARDRFGREDLAFVSYHMGIGNLEDVLEDYGARDVPWVEVFFASTPYEHRAAYERLQSFGDDSATYFWRVEAAREILRLAREDPEELDRRASLHIAKASAEERLHPPATTPRFQDADDLLDAWDAGDLRAFGPELAPLGLRRHRDMGELARRLDVPIGLYRGLRPEALALAIYVASHVRELNGGRGALTVTSTVRDQAYQDLLVQRNREATRAYSLHTTGWSLDVLREYDSRPQALAFQWMLDRLRTLDVIAWVREPAAIHITAGPDAERLLPLLDRVDDGG
jgi:soluble lytic murein transglycosylase-like protein